MHPISPIRTGVALALTAGILSLACAALVAFAPEATMAVFQSWWHGLDVTRLASPAPAMTARSLLLGEASLMASAFAAGWLFGAVYNLLSRPRHAPAAAAPG